MGLLLHKFVWSGFVSLGLQFLYIGFRVKFDRRYAYFGLSSLLLSLVFFRQAWMRPHSATVADKVLEYAFLGSGALTMLFLFLLLQHFLSLHRANRKTLDHLAEAYAGLRESARLKEVGASAASITHEIRNYAAALRGNALLMQKGLDDIQYRDEVDRIRMTAERMESIAKDVNLYAQASIPLVKKPLDLEFLVRDSMAARFFGQRLNIRVHPSPRGSGFEGDAGSLEQVFINFFKNSIEAGANAVDVRFRMLGHKLIVVIEDDGIGCLPENLESITKPFFSGKAAGGTGLGCSVAETILKSHGATLRSYAKNALGKGQSGLVLNMVFTLTGSGSASPSSMRVPVLCLDPQCRNNLVLPMIHLGIQPTLLPIDDAIENRWESEPGKSTPVFLDPMAADQFPFIQERKTTLVVDGNRTAKRIRPDAGIGLEPFLFTEETLAGLVSE